MSYIKVCDGFLSHPKVVRAVRIGGSAAVHLWLGLMSYAKGKLTDGAVPIDMLSRIEGPAPRWRTKALEALIEAGLVERGESELWVHDYLDWNLSKAEIERKSADRKMAAERRREGGLASCERRPSVVRAQGERRASVVRASSERIPVSNDPGGLSPLAPSPSRARAYETETETETEIIPPVTPPPPELALAAPTPSTAAPKARKPKPAKARSECPADFKPDETTQAEATSLGFSAELELATRKRFINWWRGNGRMMKDWQATYRNWLAKTAEERGLKPPKPDSPQRKLWLERKRQAEAPAEKPVPGAKQQVQAALAGLSRIYAS